MRSFTVLLFAVLVGALGVTSATAGGAHGIEVTFEKSVVDPDALVFAGTTGGTVRGTLESRLVPGSLTADGAVLTFAFDWIVTADQPAKSFVARTTGTFDTTTGEVVMSGVVTDGWHEGAIVEERGLLIDPATFSFAGTISILPGRSGA